MKQVRLINNIVGGSYEDNNRFAGCCLSQNLYADSVEMVSDNFYVTKKLRSVEGERIVLDFGADAFCRGVFEASDGSVFAAFGRSVYRITKDAVSGDYGRETLYTEPIPTTGRIRFSETGGVNSHVVWVDGTETLKAYPLDPTKAEALGISVPVVFKTPLRVYLTSDEIKQEVNFHVKPDFVCSLNGSIIINDPETDTWYYTDAYAIGGTDYKRNIYELDAEGNIQYESGSSYKIRTKTVSVAQEDPHSLTSYLWLDRYSKPKFQTAEFSSDRITGIVSCENMLYVVGEKTIQVYTQESSTDAQGFSSIVFNSFNRNISKLGSKAKNSIVEIDGKVAFFGSGERGERSVFAVEGGNSTRISTNAMERELEGYYTDDCKAFGYIRNGHKFYGLTFPSIKRTFVFDFATGQWHNRSTRLANGTDSNWWASFCVNFFGDVAIAGESESAIAVLDKNKYDDYNGNAIIKRRTAPVMISNGSPFKLNDVSLLWNVGTTKDVANVQGAQNPVVMLEVSTDGGNTFGAEKWAYGGKTGMYGYRTMWMGVGGIGTQIVLRFTISDRIPVEITTAPITYTLLNRF